MSIYKVFCKIITCQKLIIKEYCVCVKKRKIINILDVDLVKNRDITKLENFNTAAK